MPRSSPRARRRAAAITLERTARDLAANARGAHARNSTARPSSRRHCGSACVAIRVPIGPFARAGTHRSKAHSCASARPASVGRSDCRRRPGRNRGPIGGTLKAAVRSATTSTSTRCARGRCRWADRVELGEDDRRFKSWRQRRRKPANERGGPNDCGRGAADAAGRANVRRSNALFRRRPRAAMSAPRSHRRRPEANPIASLPVPVTARAPRAWLSPARAGGVTGAHRRG